MSALYVAMDIGCIECGEDSRCIGVFTTNEAAQAAVGPDYFAGGQHHIEVFEVAGVTEDGAR